MCRLACIPVYGNSVIGVGALEFVFRRLHSLFFVLCCCFLLLLFDVEFVACVRQGWVGSRKSFFDVATHSVLHCTHTQLFVSLPFSAYCLADPLPPPSLPGAPHSRSSLPNFSEGNDVDLRRGNAGPSLRGEVADTSRSFGRCSAVGGEP